MLSYSKIEASIRSAVLTIEDQHLEANYIWTEDFSGAWLRINDSDTLRATEDIIYSPPENPKC